MNTTMYVNIVDDDDDSREECELLVAELGWHSRLITGEFADDLGSLVSAAAERASLVICDHRLAMGDLSSQGGARVASELYELKIPAFLVTTYLEPELPKLRRYGRRLPVILSRDELTTETLKEKYQICVAELEGFVEPQRRAYRALIDVVTVYGVGIEKTVEAIIPAWNPHRAVSFALSADDADIADAILPDARLFGYVNLDAEDAARVFVDQLTLAPEAVGSLV